MPTSSTPEQDTMPLVLLAEAWYIAASSMVQLEASNKLSGQVINHNNSNNNSTLAEGNDHSLLSKESIVIQEISNIRIWHLSE